MPTIHIGVSVLRKPLPTEDTARAFLQDTYQYPESGIAHRYKRLRISVRQGQKLKSRLISENLISETLETTFHGSLRRIRLTEKGKVILFDPAKHLPQA